MKLIPKEKCINVMMWRNPDQKDLSEWEDFESGMSAMETGAGSLTAAMKLLRQGLKRGYTHFVLSYPVAMSGKSTCNNVHSLLGHPDYLKGIKNAKKTTKSRRK